MNKMKPLNHMKIQLFALIVFIAIVLWGWIVPRITGLLLPEQGLLAVYLINKGSFAIALLGAMCLIGGLNYYGFNRNFSWWFIVPGLPIILLTLALFLSPEATFDIGIAAAIGWVFVALFVGIGEECVFRGVLWRAFESRGVIVTSIATSVLFGALHLIGLFTEIPWEIIVSQAVFACGGGMMFAGIRLVTGSLLVPILLHAVFDAIAILAVGGFNELFDETMSVGRLLIPGAIFFVWGLVCVIVVQIRRSNSSNGKLSHSMA